MLDDDNNWQACTSSCEVRSTVRFHEWMGSSWCLLFELKHELRNGPHRERARGVMRLLRRREDLLATVAAELDELLANLGASAAPSGATAEPPRPTPSADEAPNATAQRIPDVKPTPQREPKSRSELGLGLLSKIEQFLTDVMGGPPKEQGAAVRGQRYPRRDQTLAAIVLLGMLAVAAFQLSTSDKRPAAHVHTSVEPASVGPVETLRPCQLVRQRVCDDFGMRSYACRTAVDSRQDSASRREAFCQEVLNNYSEWFGVFSEIEAQQPNRELIDSMGK